MARIHELIGQVQDAELRAKLGEEVKRLLKRKHFGLVFEEHQEWAALHGLPIWRGMRVARRGGKISGEESYWVVELRDGVARCKRGEAEEEIAVEELVPVAQFGEPIYPALEPLDSISNAPDSPLWHTLIEADNYHALQLLEYLYPEKVDCIYIDPPYNTGARDWKYNNDFVDGSDAWRHSKWLSMMQRRLRIAKRLLNPNDSVLIVTIDEKEVFHLGCLLEEMFPEATIQMISSVINPKGSVRDGFSRSDEYIFFVMFGACIPSRLPLGKEWSSSAIVATQEKNDNSISKKNVEPGWTSMMRRGTDSLRTDSPKLYYPIYVDPETKTIKEIGTSIPLGQDRLEEIPGLIQVLPLRSNGTQGRWQVGNVELKNRIQQGRIRLGRQTAYGFVINYLPDGEYAKVINGEFEIHSYAEDGSLIAYKKECSTDNLRMPPTQWKIASHNASENGTTLLTSVIGEKRFPFPKSLYAVRDCLRFFTTDKPNALILDFFAGSGTTLHAVNLLNAEDGGNRRCILVTNNEVSADEAKVLTSKGYRPGDAEWDSLGIARHVTWPRTTCSIRGVNIAGAPLEGTYIGSEREMREGFAANAAFFRLSFLDKDSVELGGALRELLPLLWMKANARGACPSLHNEAPSYLVLPENGFALLVDETRFVEFTARVAGEAGIDTLYLVTDSDSAFHAMVRHYSDRACYQLYRDYLENFRINNAR